MLKAKGLSFGQAKGLSSCQEGSPDQGGMGLMKLSQSMTCTGPPGVLGKDIPVFPRPVPASFHHPREKVPGKDRRGQIPAGGWGGAAKRQWRKQGIQGPALEHREQYLFPRVKAGNPQGFKQGPVYGPQRGPAKRGIGESTVHGESSHRHAPQLDKMGPGTASQGNIPGQGTDIGSA
jgi:hypothetical protein